MLRRTLPVLTAALTGAAALPATAHAGSSFHVFTSRAAYLAAVAGRGGSDRRITSGATATGTATSGRVGGENGANYTTGSLGATVTPRTAGGVFDLAAGPDAGATFSFNSFPANGIPVGSLGLGLSFRAGTRGTFTLGSGNFLGGETRTFDLAPGGTGFFGYVLDTSDTGGFQTVSLAMAPNATARITGVDVAAATVTPEPASVALVGAGLAGAGLVARRRRAARG